MYTPHNRLLQLEQNSQPQKMLFRQWKSAFVRGSCQMIRYRFPFADDNVSTLTLVCMTALLQAVDVLQLPVRWVQSAVLLRL
jgi:hypothetical protein